MGAEENGKLIWCIFCSDKRMLKKIPKSFRNRPVKAVYCKKPRLINKKTI